MKLKTLVILILLKYHGTLIISDFKEAGILKVMVVIINYYLILIWIMKKE